jgi:hypothetical protein
VGAVLCAALAGSQTGYAEDRPSPQHGPASDEVAKSARAGRLPKGSEPVDLRPEDFTTRIDNPYRPIRPGDRSVFRVTDSGGLSERSVVTVSDDTRLIANGITARVVYTVVREKGELIEDNRGWYAQDERGNVWYLGELAREFENGEVSSTKGSWEAGIDGAQPGVVMPARPKLGLAYRQEYAEGVAQDRASVFSLRERVEVPFRRFGSGVLLTKETSPLDPRGFLDYKFYAKGVGPVLGLEVSGGSDREELVSFKRRRGA